MSKQNDQVLELFNTYLEASKALTEANAVAKDLKDRKEKVEQALSLLISTGQSIAGITHTQKTQKNPPPYAKILEAVRSAFVPKSKQSEVDTLIVEMTITRTIDIFEKDSK